MIFKKSQRRITEKDRENLLLNFSSNSRYAESYRTMRTNLFFADLENELSSVAITSSVEKEGKTNTAVNLAYAVAQTGRQVLLIDCDLRRPYLSTLVGNPKEGVTELLTDILGIRLTHGTLADYSIDDLIQLTRIQKRSGRLDIANDQIQVAIFFRKGRMIDIYWKNRPDSKKLANTLIKAKLLSEKEATLALGHQKKSVRRLGSILLSMGFVSKKDLVKVLSIHSIEAIRALSSIQGNARFSFSHASVDDSRSLLDQTIDFEKLYGDFSVDGTQLKYLDAAIANCIGKSEMENLSILPAGHVPPNPGELVGSERMAFLIQHLKKKFDFIVIDTPPVIPATDALLIAPRVDGTVFVIRSGRANRKIIKDAISRFDASRLPIIGTVLNLVDMKKDGYYRYYQKYYSSYYGE